MPLLNGASGSIDDMKQQAHDLGLVLDDELIDNGFKLTDSLDQTKRAFSSIVTLNINPVAPFTIDGINANTALSEVLDNYCFEHNFKAISDIETISKLSIETPASACFILTIKHRYNF